ncbi:hypothetical protein BJP50_31510 [Paenibacillus odorifer]|uniref:Uncharacterized protein n=1 Tax=Paenibacillus odorifer TaxID=189426 RepID=A0AB36J4P1_9BACL|nr:hypothetical protein BJP50_31510 [Paenibacillus odorifer]OME06172.1 hypothetical protein BSK60_32870 [Paenibacillus odorifer]OME08919.1 hypothetical protein BSK47_32100 [Paenibacillus odorifer]
MYFNKGASYIINYGTFEKLSKFILSENGNNHFVDENGEFIISDNFLLKKKIIVSSALKH